MTIPIPKQADASQVERMREFFDGRACVVVGSAPLKTPTADVNPGEFVIAVNGAISSLPGAADLWVLNSKLQDRPGERDVKPMHKAMLSQGKGRTAGHVLLLRGPKVMSEDYTLGKLQAMGVTYHSWSLLDKPTKRAFEGEHCGRVKDARPCSAGIFTVAMALHLGASHVRMVGISFKAGYQYLPNEQPMAWWRDHLEADKLALDVLSKRYGARLSGSLIRAEVAA